MSIRLCLCLAALFSVLMFSACATDPPQVGFDALDFELADAGSGEKLFNQSNDEAPACAACHSVTGEDSGVGNSLAGIAAVAGQRVSGQSARQYLYWSIVRPARHLVSGYANLMYADYDERLETADIADLIVYMLTLQ